jgi:hypothetical protein
MMRELDSFLLARATRFSHAIQRTTGITNYFIAKVGVGIAAIGLLADIVNYFLHLILPSPTLWIVVLDFLFLIDMIWRSLILSRADEHNWSSNRAKPAELLRFTESYLWRLFWFGAFIVDCFRIVGHRQSQYFGLIVAQKAGLSLGLCIFGYFVAVDPLPPGMSKLRQWLSAFGQHQELAKEHGQ